MMNVDDFKKLFKFGNIRNLPPSNSKNKEWVIKAIQSVSSLLHVLH